MKGTGMNKNLCNTAFCFTALSVTKVGCRNLAMSGTGSTNVKGAGG